MQLKTGLANNFWFIRVILQVERTSHPRALDEVDLPCGQAAHLAGWSLLSPRVYSTRDPIILWKVCWLTWFQC